MAFRSHHMAGLSPYCIAVCFPREDGSGLPLGQGEVLVIGAHQVPGQGSQLCTLRVAGPQLQVLCQHLLPLHMGHTAKTDGWRADKDLIGWSYYCLFNKWCKIVNKTSDTSIIFGILMCLLKETNILPRLYNRNI